MWIVVGHRVKTERVAGGARVERECGSCGEEATFYERRVVSTFRLYFVDVFDYGKRRVMACGACGALYETDEHGQPGAETSAGWERTLADVGERAKAAVDRAGSVIAPMIESAGAVAADAVESASSALGPAAKRASEGLGDALGKRSSGGRPADAKERPRRPTEEHEREEDPEKAALLRRFAELEKKLKAGKGD